MKAPKLPPLDTLAHDVFQLVEKDQGKGFVPESVGSQHRDHEQFFDRARACEFYTRRAANKLRKFLRKQGEESRPQ